MGRYMRKCKGLIGEVTIMEVSDVVDMDLPATTKKRKICHDGDVKQQLSPALLRLRNHSGAADTPETEVSPENCASREPAGSSTSCCSSNSESLDLDENGMEVVTSAENRVTRSSKERQSESGELESTKMPKHENSRRITPEKVPSESEIEEFFAECEKDMFKRFREKYNFDFEKEEAVEGRYKWVQT